MEEIGVQIRRLNYKVKVLVHAGKQEIKKAGIARIRSTSEAPNYKFPTRSPCILTDNF